MTSRKTLFIALFTLLMISCDTSFTAKFYVSDFFSDDDKISAKAVITSEFSESEEQQIIDMLKESFEGATNFRKEEVGYSEHLKFDYKFNIIDESKFDINNTASLFNFVYNKTSDNKVAIGIAMNKANFDTLNSKVSSEFYGSIDMKELKFVIELNNDFKHDVNISVKSSYVDGNPIPFQKDLTMEGRSTVEIKFSEILKEALKTQDTYYFLEMTK